MQNKKFLTTLTGISSLFLSLTAHANMSVPFGWYLEANAGSAHLSNHSEAVGSSSTSGLSGNLNVGYKFMPFLGIEFGYTRYSNSKITVNDVTVASNRLFSYDIAARGILAMSDTGFEVFGKLGAERINSKIQITNTKVANQVGLTNSSHNTTGLYLGVGGQYYFYPALAAVVQWQRANGNSDSGTMDLYSLGISYTFD